MTCSILPASSAGCSWLAFTWLAALPISCATMRPVCRILGRVRIGSACPWWRLTRASGRSCPGWLACSCRLLLIRNASTTDSMMLVVVDRVPGLSWPCGPSHHSTTVRGSCTLGPVRLYAVSVGMCQAYYQRQNSAKPGNTPKTAGF